MRTSLSCDVTLRHFGVWRIAVGLVCLTTLAVLAAWATQARPAWPPAALAAASVSGLAVVGLAISLARIEAGKLRLENGLWTFIPEDEPSRAEHGHVVVEIDLGSFMLLSWSCSAANGRTTFRRWLPAQRSGLEGDWHALRCAVHSPRRGPDSEGAGPGATPE